MTLSKITSNGFLYVGYLPSSLVLNREKLVRVVLACDFRVNQSRSSIAKFFKESAIAGLLKVSDAGKYAYGYEVLDLLKKKRKSKPTVKGDRYHTKDSGQALRYGEYAVVAVTTSLGTANSKTETEAVNAVLSQWKKFEAWAEKLPTNATYKLGSSFDYVNYYKGSTINTDLQNHVFTI